MSGFPIPATSYDNFFLFVDEKMLLVWKALTHPLQAEPQVPMSLYGIKTLKSFSSMKVFKDKCKTCPQGIYSLGNETCVLMM